MEKTLKEVRNELIGFLYQADLLETNELEIEDEKIQAMFNEIQNNLPTIDETIKNSLFNYQLERLSYIDRAIIRLATYELKYTDLASAIIINEAVKLTKTLSDLDDEKQHKFNNKVLDNINKTIRG